MAISSIRQFLQKPQWVLARAKVAEIKSKPCAICGVQYNPWVMQFDHLDHTTKKNDIARMVNMSYSWKTILSEIEKCRVLCANCHAEVSHQDRLKYRVRLCVVRSDNQINFAL